MLLQTAEVPHHFESGTKALPEVSPAIPTGHLTTEPENKECFLKWGGKVRCKMVAHIIGTSRLSIDSENVRGGHRTGNMGIWGTGGAVFATGLNCTQLV